MGHRIAESHIRLRTTLKGEWIWELITGDGHVASVSRGYTDREPCETEARSQGLRVVGGRRAPRQRHTQRSAGIRMYASGRGLWHWEHFDDAGEIVAASPVAFLSKDDCERHVARCLGDVRAQGIKPAPTQG